jgi:large subunit ribosomal protein L3
MVSEAARKLTANLTGSVLLVLAATTTPGRVYKGSRGPGHMGDDRVTTQNLKVVLVDPERNLLGVRAARCPDQRRRCIIKLARKQ